MFYRSVSPRVFIMCAYEAVVLLLDIPPTTEFYTPFYLLIYEILIMRFFIFYLSSKELYCIRYIFYFTSLFYFNSL